ncbi:MAG TPA: hypothetical protein ENI85_04060 [Deltaproteobacteria bacterium]|nr:hypothetical protein [Deltaproteobacteria bacterium]
MESKPQAVPLLPRCPIRVWTTILAILVLSSCERTPSKSDYVSARVTEMCQGRSGEALQSCRIAVIKQFSDMPFEEMKRRYPPPPPRPRPSCEIF